MKTKLIISIFYTFCVLYTNSQSIDLSHFGASAASWASSEGWSNFQNLGVHYMRMPIDIQKNVIVDNFFLNQFDNYVSTGQTNNIIMYGIINPKRNISDQYPSANEFYNAVQAIVEHYDGDGVNDMTGLIYPITNWEMCNEITWSSLCDNDPNCQWKNFGRNNYLLFMDTAQAAVKSACSFCNLLNGAQVDPPSVSISGQGFSTLKELIDSLGNNIIDAISYHNYNNLLQSNTAMQDFTNYGIANKIIWATETDMQNEYNLDTTLTQDDNPRLCIPSFVYAFYQGFDKIIYTSMRAQTSAPVFVKWGSLLDPQTGSKRKIYYAFKKLIEKIDYFTNVVAASPNNNSTIFAYEFTVQSKPVYVLWSTSNQSVVLNLSSTSVTSVTTTSSVPSDTLGNFSSQNIVASGGNVILNISPTAIYVEEVLGTGIYNVGNNLSNDLLKIYPNPFKNSTMLEIEDMENQNYELKIYDMFGKIVEQSEIKNQKSEINLDLPNGIYFLQIKSNNYLQTIKLEVIK